jgi:hypothetical protein
MKVHMWLSRQPFLNIHNLLQTFEKNGLMVSYTCTVFVLKVQLQKNTGTKIVKESLSLWGPSA